MPGLVPLVPRLTMRLGATSTEIIASAEYHAPSADVGESFEVERGSGWRPGWAFRQACCFYVLG